MFDHVTLRVPDLAVATRAFAAVLDELELTQTTSTPSFSVWGNFALTQTDEEHPIARRVHVAFIAPTPAHVERFGQAGIAAGFADDGPAGPRPNYADDYYAACLKDGAGNSFEAVHRDGDRPQGQHRSRRHPCQRRRGVNRVLLNDRRCRRPHDPAPNR